MDPSDYVLQDFGENERPVMDEVFGWVVSAVECWLTDGINIAMTRFNRGVASGE
jgi:peptidyl-tRNA hydrolase